MTRNSVGLQSQAGTTLIELLVAAGLMSITMLVAGGLLLSSGSVIQNEVQRQDVTGQWIRFSYIVQSAMDQILRIRAGNANGNGTSPINTFKLELFNIDPDAHGQLIVDWDSTARFTDTGDAEELNTIAVFMYENASSNTTFANATSEHVAAALVMQMNKPEHSGVLYLARANQPNPAAELDVNFNQFRIDSVVESQIINVIRSPADNNDLVGAQLRVVMRAFSGDQGTKLNRHFCAGAYIGAEANCPPLVGARDVERIVDFSFKNNPIGPSTEFAGQTERVWGPVYFFRFTPAEIN